MVKVAPSRHQRMSDPGAAKTSLRETVIVSQRDSVPDGLLHMAVHDLMVCGFW